MAERIPLIKIAKTFYLRYCLKMMDRVMPYFEEDQTSTLISLRKVKLSDYPEVFRNNYIKKQTLRRELNILLGIDGMFSERHRNSKK